MFCFALLCFVWPELNKQSVWRYFWIWNMLFYWWLLSEPIFMIMAAKWWISNSRTPSVLTGWRWHSPPLFSYLFVYLLLIWIHFYFFFSGLWFIIVLDYLVFTLSQLWPVGAPLSWLLCLLLCPIMIFSTSLFVV